MSKSIAVGDALYKYYIEDNQLKVISGVLIERKSKRYVNFGSDGIPDESFPGHRNIDRVWKGGEILWLTERDDALAKQLFTTYHVGIIKELQKQIDDAGDRISMIRRTKIKDASSRSSKCFGDIKVDKPKKSDKPSYASTYSDNYDASEFVNAEQYAERKITMLRHEMFIDLSDEDERHMRSLTSRGAIDACVRAMINKYWV